MDLKHDTLSTMYEGENPSMYSEFTAKQLNIPSRQLLENDQALLVEAERVKLLSTENKQNSDNNKSGLITAGSRISALETLVSADERLKVWDLNIPSPLNVNGFLIGGLTLGPVGYSGAGKCVVSAVSAYTKGFQGSYYGEKPSDAASTQDAAKASKPFYYGAYQTGPRTLGGGLGGGHHTPSNYFSTTESKWKSDASKEGCLLRIHKPSGGQNSRTNACLVTMKHFCNTRKVRFKAYVWVDSGPKTFKLGPLNPWGTISVANLKEWTPVDVVITTNGSTGKYWRIILDTNSEQTIYIAMLGIYPLTGKAVGNTMSTINVED